ncbi:MAG: glycine--tRNA ligase subunit beta [Burkholderiales bacterium]
MKASLLVELFTEELPPRALARLGGAFASQIQLSLGDQGLLDSRATSTFFATPRRLAVKISHVLARAPDRAETKKLMPVKIAYDTDGPTPALLKRLEKEGFPPGSFGNQIKERLQEREGYVFFEQAISGLSLSSGLQAALEEAIAKLPIPKVMTYQLADGTDQKFVRPAHGLVVLHGDKVVDVSVLGLRAGRVTHGHRFQGVKDITIATADAYEEALAAHGKVIASFDKRRQEIERQLTRKAVDLKLKFSSEPSLTHAEELIGLNDALVDEVTSLVEYPTVYVGEFEQEYLAVPQECLILTMRANQKYFPLFNAAGKLTNRFLIVSNMDLKDPKNIVEGNQRVVRPRFEDARFFFEQDRKQRLETRVPQLAKVVYHNRLGSQLERVERVQLLAGRIARELKADAALAGRAAWLSKADLLTGMVGEFPELQGVMGRYYALGDGEPKEVSDAIEQHYRPRFAGDSLPQGPVACAVALADKLDTLAGLFGIGQQPTGDKDPFGLRRAALGVIRIVVEHQLPLSLHESVNAAFAGYDRKIGDAHTDLEIFVFERLSGYLKELGYSTLQIEAVLSRGFDQLSHVPRQLDAVKAFQALPEAESLASANKRVANILKQAAARGESYVNADRKELKEPAELSLFDALERTSASANQLFERGDYTGYLKTFAVLKAPVDAFFDSVMVMVEQDSLRKNRLALLTDLRDAMNRVADISKLAA